MAISVAAQFLLEQNLLRYWIDKAKTGDQAAFESILAAHERMVLRIAQRLLTKPEDAKDAAQEVFLKLHRNLGHFRQDKKFVLWLYRMTVNACLDWRRRSRPGLPMDLTQETSDRSPNPEQAFCAAQERMLIMNALRHLPERERLAIVLRDIEGRSTAEVADMLGSSESTVRSQISTGRMKSETIYRSVPEKRSDALG